MICSSCERDRAPASSPGPWTGSRIHTIGRRHAPGDDGHRPFMAPKYATIHRTREGEVFHAVLVYAHTPTMCRRANIVESSTTAPTAPKSCAIGEGYHRAPPSAAPSTTALTALLNRWRAWWMCISDASSARGYTRLVRRTVMRLRGPSLHACVPVYPVWV